MDFVSTNDNFVSRELKIEVNKYGIIKQITSNCYNILQYTSNEMINTYFCKYFNYSFDSLIRIGNFNIEFQRKDGVMRYFDVQVTPLIINNQIESVFLSIIDVTKYKELENKDKVTLKMLEHTKDIVCRLELLPKPRFTYLSPSVENMLGFTLEELFENPMLPFERTHPDDKEIQYSKIKAHTDFSKLFQVRMMHKDGYYIWIEDYVIPQYNEYNQLVAVESITRNIQDRKELEERLEKLSYTDNLTGLFNKNYFLNKMNLFNTKINIPIGIILCDLDRLKYTNDSLGHSYGDDLIKHTGKVLKSVFNNEHIISRTGGDEFVVIVKNKSFLDFQKLYIDLQRALKDFNENSKNIPIEISIGLSYSDTSISKMRSILDTADTDMYKKKRYKKQIGII